ncbi:MAG: hypothetical protein PHS53_00035 [Candidatus Pacebacteria bacterium]|nr:hypothetical protein [Candidatus Paceibacterota bacterium]MDD5356524.1 hypothetical protein [Candidatus Paceibacterota bacterium]
MFKYIVIFRSPLLKGVGIEEMSDSSRELFHDYGAFLREKCKGMTKKIYTSPAGQNIEARDILEQELRLMPSGEAGIVEAFLHGAYAGRKYQDANVLPVMDFVKSREKDSDVLVLITHHPYVRLLQQRFAEEYKWKIIPTVFAPSNGGGVIISVGEETIEMVQKPTRWQEPPVQGKFRW